MPLFVSALNTVEAARRIRIVLRECLIAFLVLLLFLFFGRPFLTLLRISQTSLGMAGGVILFLIALRMIFRLPPAWVRVASVGRRLSGRQH